MNHNSDINKAIQKAAAARFLVGNAEKILDALFQTLPGIDTASINISFRHAIEDMEAALHIIKAD